MANKGRVYSKRKNKQYRRSRSLFGPAIFHPQAAFILGCRETTSFFANRGDSSIAAMCAFLAKPSTAAAEELLLCFKTALGKRNATKSFPVAITKL
ncbi:hypothetical protein L596_012440 [Steinernema carpocapsae]|uniref:Uncharacterized protein n=1 Tax=Steinernema carpocapsae TaxID=34508 RepID=A0A4U5NXX9_STECR|nr:hypothetical protein L596_012440 [Steinernema carpocapsae]